MPTDTSERLTLPQQRSRETRQRILDAAYSVFARHGFGQASVDDVAREAGISKGALYHHFSSKEELFQELLRDRVRSCATKMLLAATPITPLAQALRKIIAVSFDSYHSDPNWTPMFVEFWGQAVRDGTARSVVAESYRGCRETVAQILRSGQDANLVRRDLDPDTVAVLYIAMVDGIRMQIQVDEHVNLEQAKDAMANMIVEFVKPKRKERV